MKEFTLKEDNQVRLNINIDRSLRSKFKSVCARNDQDMTSLLLSFISDYISNQENDSAEKTA